MPEPSTYELVPTNESTADLTYRPPERRKPRYSVGKLFIVAVVFCTVALVAYKWPYGEPATNQEGGSNQLVPIHDDEDLAQKPPPSDTNSTLDTDPTMSSGKQSVG